MEKSQPKIYLGFIAYGKSTAKYLPYFLPTLKRQNFKDYKILAIDNTEAEVNENSIFIKNNFPEIDLKWAGENLGFAKAFNLMIRQAVTDGAEYFLALNPDIILENNFIENTVNAIESDSRIGAVAPKILKWDFENNKKTDQIDSLGLRVSKEHRFYDAHQGEKDNSLLRSTSEVFGFTGAAVLLNLEILQDIAFENGINKEYFDELMFMYKEDCDLSYRLRLAGWKIILAPKAVAYHDRSVASVGETNLKIALNRRSKSRMVKKWSFLNQWILLLKLRDLPFSWKVKLATSWYQIKSLIFVVLFEQFLLKEVAKLWRLKPVIKKRRDQLKLQSNIIEIEKFMDFN